MMAMDFDKLAAQAMQMQQEMQRAAGGGREASR